jgi:hypothetical protein
MAGSRDHLRDSRLALPSSARKLGGALLLSYPEGAGTPADYDDRGLRAGERRRGEAGGGGSLIPDFSGRSIDNRQERSIVQLH